MLLDSAKQKVHSLNQWATIVWLLCDGTRSAQRILELTAPDEQRQASVKDVLEAFRQEGLIESVHCDGAGHSVTEDKRVSMAEPGAR